jgi:hypothetical protein
LRLVVIGVDNYNIRIAVYVVNNKNGLVESFFGPVYTMNGVDNPTWGGG